MLVFKLVVHRCGKSFKSQTHFREHQESVHLKCNNFTCQFCSYSTSRKGNLTLHIKKVMFIIIRLFYKF